MGVRVPPGALRSRSRSRSSIGQSARLSSGRLPVQARSGSLVALAQLARAPGCDPGECGFESRAPPLLQAGSPSRRHFPSKDGTAAAARRSHEPAAQVRLPLPSLLISKGAVAQSVERESEKLRRWRFESSLHHFHRHHLDVSRARKPTAAEPLCTRCQEGSIPSASTSLKSGTSRIVRRQRGPPSQDWLRLFRDNGFYWCGCRCVSSSFG